MATQNQDMLTLIEAKLAQLMAPEGVKRYDIAESSMSRYLENLDLKDLNDMHTKYLGLVAQEKASNKEVSPLATLTGVMQ